MNIKLANNQVSSTAQEVGNGRRSLYETMVAINPALKSVLDFKTILFSDTTNKFTPEECEQIYNGKKKINLVSDVKFVDGKIEIRSSKSEVQETLMKLKLMNMQARMKQGERSPYDKEYDYENEEGDEEYEDIYDEEDMDNLYGDDEYEYDDGYDYDEENDIDYQDDRFYKQMLRDMEQDIDQEIHQKLDQDIHTSSNNRFKQQTFLSKKSEVQIKVTDKQESSKINKDSTHVQKIIQGNEGKDEWQTDSEEWEDDDEEEHEDQDDDEEEEEESDDNTKINKQKLEDKKKNHAFSSIKVSQEDYKD